MNPFKAGFISIVVSIVLGALLRYGHIEQYWQGYIIGAVSQFTYWVLLLKHEAKS